MKLIKNKPVSLILTYDNGHVLEFNIKTLADLSTTTYSSKGEPTTKELSITLIYEKMIEYDKEPINLLESATENSPAKKEDKS